MLNISKRLWAALVFALTLFGIFWLPKDIEDYSDAAKPWRRFLAMVDQNTALWVFSLALLGWLFWIELRPLFARWRQPKSDFGVEHHVHKESHVIENEVGDQVADLYENVFSIAIRNDRKDKKTIRNVRAHAFMINGPVELRPKDNLGSYDLRDGEYMFFAIGKSYDRTMAGFVRMPRRKLKNDEIDGYVHNANIPNIACLHIVAKDADYKHGLGQLDNRSIPFWVRITGDDCAPLEIQIDFDLLAPDLNKDGVWVCRIGEKLIRPLNSETSLLLPRGTGLETPL